MNIDKHTEEQKADKRKMAMEEHHTILFMIGAESKVQMITAGWE